MKKILAEAQELFPPDMEYRIVVDQTRFIEESMEEVAYTFGEALLLVAVIVYLFLGNGRATLITLLAVLVSLTATFFFFYLFNFSLNLLTLFALILAIGLVVDDAIVIIESVSRHLERGLPVKEAASAAMEEVQGPIVAIAFVLAAVFVPVAFLPGMTGTLYRQFALTLVAHKYQRCLRFLFVRNSDGVMVPLDTLVKAKRSSGPANISRYDGVRSVHFEVSAGDGYSSGEAMDAMEEVVHGAAPSGFQLGWSGTSRHAREAQGETAMLLLLSLVFVFLCLTFIYESWRLPWAVLLSVSVGIGGALLSEIAAQQPGSLYMQIGILLVVALAAKNAILIVEFARQRQLKGASLMRATVTAAQLRLRPILMTSVAFIAGCLPLALAEGAGSGARSNMGIAVVGGMSLATLLGVLVVPVLYMVVAGKWKKHYTDKEDIK